MDSKHDIPEDLQGTIAASFLEAIMEADTTEQSKALIVLARFTSDSQDTIELEGKDHILLTFLDKSVLDISSDEGRLSLRLGQQWRVNEGRPVWAEEEESVVVTKDDDCVPDGVTIH